MSTEIIDSTATPPKKDRSRNILLNTITSYADDVIDAIAMLILIPFLIRVIGVESFGLWSLVWAFVSLFELADLGFAASVVKYVADAKGRGDIDRMRKIVATLFWIYVILGAVLLSGFTASLMFFNRIFEIPESQQSAARFVLIVLGARSALLMPLGMFRGVMAGYQKASIANIYKSISAIIYFIASIAVLTFIPDIRAFAIVSLIMGILPMIGIAIHAKRTMPGVDLSLKAFDRKVIREVSSFSVYFTIIQVSRFIYTRVDSIIIKAFLPLQTVGVYAIAMRLSEKASQFCFQLIKSLAPVVAELHAAGEKENIRAVWERGTKLAVAFAAPLLVGLAVLSEPMIRAWTGPGFEEATAACQWLVAAAMVNVIHGNTSSLLSMSGHQKFIAMTSLVSQVANIILSVILIRPFGIAGVSMATFFVTLPLQMIVIQGRAGREYELSHWRFYRTTVLPSVFPAMVMVAAFYGIQRLHTLTNLVEVAALEGVGVLIFGAVFWITGFNSHEREYFKEKAVRRFMRRRTKLAA